MDLRALMAESEGLKSLLMKVKEESEKVVLIDLSLSLNTSLGESLSTRPSSSRPVLFKRFGLPVRNTFYIVIECI